MRAQNKIDFIVYFFQDLTRKAHGVERDNSNTRRIGRFNRRTNIVSHS
jgi:hypothetical protein